VGFVVGGGRWWSVGRMQVRGDGQGQSARHSSDFLIRVCYLRVWPSMSRSAVDVLDCLKRISYREVLFGLFRLIERISYRSRDS